MNKVNLWPGVNIVVAGGTRGVATDLDGSFTIAVLPTDALQVSYLGMEDMTVAIKGRTELIITMRTKPDELDEVTVVAFAKQKKESVIASVSTVKPAELKVPSSNLTTALAGRVAGLIAYQRSGEPGSDDASFFVRGVTSFTYARGPLILIDGVEMSSSDFSTAAGRRYCQFFYYEGCGSNCFIWCARSKWRYTCYDERR